MAADGTHATVTRPLLLAAMSEIPRMADSRSSSAARARSRNTRPSGVSSTARVVRLNNRAPRMVSSLSMRRLKAGADK